MITCSHCQNTFNPTMLKCPFCGTPKPKARISSGNCPRCKTQLSTSKSAPQDAFHCEQCNGLWLSERLFKRSTSFRSVIKDDSIPHEYVKPLLKNDPGYLSCPSCDKLMVRENFRKVSCVFIDKCKEHGVWLDHGELDKIREFVANGGIDASQDQELKNQTVMIRQLQKDVKIQGDRLDWLEHSKHLIDIFF